jgi:hypothetical protein
MSDLCAMLDTAVAAMDGSHAALQNSSSTLISANEDLLSRANAFGARALGQVSRFRAVYVNVRLRLEKNLNSGAAGAADRFCARDRHGRGTVEI